METKQHIWVVEDEKMIRDFLVAILQANGYEVVAMAAGSEVLTRVCVSGEQPDLILLDLGLPDVDGLIVMDTIRQWMQTPIVVVSAREHEKDKVEALDRGADDYVTKPFNNNELLARIRTALRRTKVPADGETQEEALPFEVYDLRIDYVRRLVTLKGEPVHLTPNEYKILAILSLNAGRVITHEALLREVWGPYAADNQILRVNMANIRRKIEENPGDPTYILTEVGVGYRMVEPATDVAVEVSDE